MLYFGGPIFLSLVVALTVLANALSIWTTYWLTIWVEAYNKIEPVDIGYYAGIYAVIMLIYSTVDGIEYLVYTRGAWNAARQLHQRLLEGVLNAPLSWWKNIPVGRVVNRFSKDIKSL